MKYDDIHPALRNALGIHEGFRKLNYPSDDIFIGQQGGIVFVVLKANGKEFTCEAGPMDQMTNEAFAAIWGEAVRAWNNGELSPDDLTRIYLESIPGSDSIVFLTALMKKGVFPRQSLGPEYN